MPFVQVERGRTAYTGTPMVRVVEDALDLNTAAMKFFAGVKYVNVYYDSATQRIAIASVREKGRHTFTLTRQGNLGRISAASFLRSLKLVEQKCELATAVDGRIEFVITVRSEGKDEETAPTATVTRTNGSMHS